MHTVAVIAIQNSSCGRLFLSIHLPGVVNSSNSSPFWLSHYIVMKQKNVLQKSTQNLIYMTMHKLNHYFMIYLTNKCANLYISL